MLLGFVYYPVELADDLLDRWLPVPGTQKLLEDPGVAERAAREEDSRSAGLLVGSPGLLGVSEAAGQENRSGQRLDQLTGQVVVRLALVLLRGMPRVKGDAGHTRVLDQASRDVEPTAVPGEQAGAQLHRDGEAAALDGSASDRDGLVGVLE